MQAIYVNPSDFQQLQLVLPGTRGGAAVTRPFTFHACLGPESHQQDVMRLCGIPQLLDAGTGSFPMYRYKNDALKPMHKAVPEQLLTVHTFSCLCEAMDGFNATVMAYGQTGSGKTFTMSGREDVMLDDGYRSAASVQICHDRSVCAPTSP